MAGGSDMVVDVDPLGGLGHIERGGLVGVCLSAGHGMIIGRSWEDISDRGRWWGAGRSCGDMRGAITFYVTVNFWYSIVRV